MNELEITFNPSGNTIFGNWSLYHQKWQELEQRHLRADVESKFEGRTLKFLTGDHFTFFIDTFLLSNWVITKEMPVDRVIATFEQLYETPLDKARRRLVEHENAARENASDSEAKAWDKKYDDLQARVKELEES